jgi:hypothetical protein
MNSTKKTARVAGLLYLLASIPGAFCLIYVPSHFIVSGDAVATASKIVASEFVFRLGIVSELASFTGSSSWSGRCTAYSVGSTRRMLR